MGRDDDLIIENNEKAGLRCPKCQSPNWIRDGNSFTFILKTYKCLDCDTHWLMFKQEIYKKSGELNE
jgi:DNA-directed RNA polymerase subunit RPC12/RpoP